MSEHSTHDSIALHTLPPEAGASRRTASFRPSQEVSLPEATLQAFYTDMERDASLGPHEEGSLADHLFALAQVREAQGEHEAANLLLNQFRHAHGRTEHMTRAARRNWRKLDEWSMVERSLRQSEPVNSLMKSLDRLEATQINWLSGAGADQIALSLEDLNLHAQGASEEDLAFVTTWRTLLMLDVLLAHGSTSDAAEVLGTLAKNQALSGQIRSFASLMLAGISQLDENHAEAVGHVLEALPQRAWSQELVDWLSQLLGSNHNAQKLLELVPDSVATGRFMAAYRARLAQKGGQPLRAKVMLDAVLEVDDTDAMTLALHEEILETLGASKQDSDMALRQALIQVLNLRLETTKNEDECVSILLRIGRLYESLGDADGEAAEVYREALGLVPDDASVLRALGRLYHRSGSFEQLVSLYEHEIIVFAGDGAMWRRHFQVAKLYEERLGDKHAALEHYMSVLGTQPHFLPALKATARLLEQTEQWAMLAGIFLERVPGSTNNRQRLYLLDKVAQIAEDHLGDAEIAIGAWQEILGFAPNHPAAYAALGRLYSKAGKWQDLIALNRMEMGLVEDVEEVADLYLKNAQIYVRHCQDEVAAEACYREALALIPDFLPALEGLGQLLVSSGRWEDVMKMTSQEVAALGHPRHQARQLGALAELAEFQLGRVEDAIKLHEEVLELVPGNLTAYFTLHRLYRETNQWGKLVVLKEERLHLTTEPGELAVLYGELGELYEWHTEAPDRAFHAYRAALSIEPGQRHWLDSLMRLRHWAPISTAQLIAWLEQVIATTEKNDIKDRYVLHVARLKEHSSGSAEAGLDARRAIQSPSLETGVIRRLAEPMISRASLVKLRAFSPMFDWEAAVSIPRHGTERLPLDMTALWGTLPKGVKSWMSQELELCAVANLAYETSDQHVMLGLELAKLAGQGARVCDALAGTDTSAIRQHLRAVEAGCCEDQEEREAWLRREMSKVQRSDLWLSRGLELARLWVDDDVKHVELLEQAARPLLQTPVDGERPAVIDSPVTEELYDVLYRASAWDLLRRCLENHLSYSNLGKIRSSYLYDMLSDMLERFAKDYSAALDARMKCWELTQETDHLIALVRLSQELGQMEEAIEYQRLFVGHLWPRRDISATRCIEAGLGLAKLLREHGGRQGTKDAIEVLDALVERFDTVCDCVDVRLELARAHASGGDARTAIELFKHALTPEKVAGRRDDWREFVRLWRDGAGDSCTAYNLQWTLVRHDPTNHQDMQTLIDLAEESDALDNCATELVRLSQMQSNEETAKSLIWAAATIFDEFLGWFEDACELYDELLEEETDAQERVRLLRRQAFCFARIPNKQASAMATFHRLLEADPFDVATYRGMSVLLGEIDTMDRARIVMQIQRALGDQVEREKVRTKTVPSRPIEDAGALEILLPEELQEGVVRTVGAAMPLVHKLWADKLPQKKALENNRRAAREFSDVTELFEDLFSALELGRPRVWFGDSMPLPVVVVCENNSPLVWLNTEAISQFDEAELRFLAGYCAALIWSELGAMQHLDGRRMWHLLEGVHLRQTGRGFGERVDMMSQELADAVSSPLFAVARRRLMQTMEPATEQLANAHCERWATEINHFAFRLGMVLCGDVEAMTRCVLKLDGWRGELGEPEAQKMIRRHTHLRELFQFAMSEDFLQVRYLLGLSGRPSKVRL